MAEETRLRTPGEKSGVNIVRNFPIAPSVLESKQDFFQRESA